MRSKRCRLLQLRGDLRALDEAAFALAVSCHAPEVRAVIDIERGLNSGLAGDPQRLEHGSLGACVAQVRSRHHDRPCGPDQILLDVVLTEGHVGAILAIKDEREVLPVTDTEDDKGRQALGVHLHTARVDPLARKLFDDESPHVLVAHSGDHSGRQSEPRRATGDIRR
jgi:hypothetical protein